MKFTLDEVLERVLPMHIASAEYHYRLMKKNNLECDYMSALVNRLHLDSLMAKRDYFLEGRKEGYQEGFAKGYNNGVYETEKLYREHPEDEPVLGDRVAQITHLHLAVWNKGV